MRSLKLLYPNNNFWNGSEFHWALCGKKVWMSGSKRHYLELSSSVRFFDPKTGKTYRPSKKQKLKLLICGKLNKSDIQDLWNIIEERKLDGVALNSQKGGLNKVWCSSWDFVFVRGLKEVKNPDRCPLIRFVRINNSKLRRSNILFPTCQEIDSLLQRKSCDDVCRDLAGLLNLE